MQATAALRAADSSRCLARADFPITGFNRRLLLVSVRSLPAEWLVWYRGKMLLVLDLTDYPQPAAAATRVRHGAAALRSASCAAP